jgi:hypothetical protein
MCTEVNQSNDQNLLKHKPAEVQAAGAQERHRRKTGTIPVVHDSTEHS